MQSLAIWAVIDSEIHDPAFFVVADNIDVTGPRSPQKQVPAHLQRLSAVRWNWVRAITQATLEELQPIGPFSYLIGIDQLYSSLHCFKFRVRPSYSQVTKIIVDYA